MNVYEYACVKGIQHANMCTNAYIYMHTYRRTNIGVESLFFLKWLNYVRRYKSTILAISTREKEVEKHSDAMLLELSEAKKENRSKNGFSFAIQYLLER